MCVKCVSKVEHDVKVAVPVPARHLEEADREQGLVLPREVGREHLALALVGVGRARVHLVRVTLDDGVLDEGPEAGVREHDLEPQFEHFERKYATNQHETSSSVTQHTVHSAQHTATAHSHGTDTAQTQNTVEAHGHSTVTTNQHGTSSSVM